MSTKTKEEVPPPADLLVVDKYTDAYEQQLKKMSEFAGFVAALDQSGGSTPKALSLYGIPSNTYVEGTTSMYDKMHSFRERIITSKVFNGDRIIGTILFEDTLRRSVSIDVVGDGVQSQLTEKTIGQYIWDDLDIVPFLKIDEGLLEEQNGVQLMKEMKNLHSLLDLAVEHHVFGTKARSVIKHADTKGIRANVEQQFTVARTVMQRGLHPIIEPEVDINLEIDEKKKAEMILKDILHQNLNKLHPNEKVLLKLTLPSVDNYYKDIISHPNVIRVVALSGGYDRHTANELLAKNEHLVASFSRALTEGLHVTDTEEEFDQKLDDSIESIYLASVSGMYE